MTDNQEEGSAPRGTNPVPMYQGRTKQSKLPRQIELQPYSYQIGSNQSRMQEPLLNSYYPEGGDGEVANEEKSGAAGFLVALGKCGLCIGVSCCVCVVTTVVLVVLFLLRTGTPFVMDDSVCQTDKRYFLNRLRTNSYICGDGCQWTLDNWQCQGQDCPSWVNDFNFKLLAENYDDILVGECGHTYFQSKSVGKTGHSNEWYYVNNTQDPDGLEVIPVPFPQAHNIDESSQYYPLQVDRFGNLWFKQGTGRIGLYEIKTNKETLLDSKPFEKLYFSQSQIFVSDGGLSRRVTYDINSPQNLEIGSFAKVNDLTNAVVFKGVKQTEIGPLYSEARDWRSFMCPECSRWDYANCWDYMWKLKSGEVKDLVPSFVGAGQIQDTSSSVTSMKPTIELVWFNETGEVHVSEFLSYEHDVQYTKDCPKELSQQVVQAGKETYIMTARQCAGAEPTDWSARELQFFCVRVKESETLPGLYSFSRSPKPWMFDLDILNIEYAKDQMRAAGLGLADPFKEGEGKIFQGYSDGSVLVKMKVFYKLDQSAWTNGETTRSQWEQISADKMKVLCGGGGEFNPQPI